MTASTGLGAVAEFYHTHPISERQILEKLAAEGVSLEGLTEDVLQRHDQDHYGGTEVNVALAELAGIGADDNVLDVCCGLGGPARYFAHNYGCTVTGIDLTESRIEGARSLTELTGLTDKVSFVSGNALDLPFEEKSFDIVVSQEAFCHVPDKARLISECMRVLRPGGKLAFTDVLTTAKTTETQRERLRQEMTFHDLATREVYTKAVEAAGGKIEAIVDLGGEWRDILRARLDMYRSLKDQTVARFGIAHFEKWDRAYAFFVGLYETGELSGARILARRVKG